MKTMETATDWVHWVLGAGGVAVGAMTAKLYDLTHKRIDGLEEDVKSKAEHETVLHTAATIQKIFDRLDSHIQDETAQFQQIVTAINVNHVEVIKELSKKMDR